MIINMALSLQQEFAQLPVEMQGLWLAEQSLETLEEILREEWWWASRPEQVPPETAYIIFLYLAGRGTGKTRSGSEWIVERTQRYPHNRAGKPTEHLVVAESLSEARKVCVEGDSGILYVLERRKIDYHYTRSPKPKIILPDTGSKIFFEGADNPDCGRGGNNTSMWLDEVCTWRNPERVWIEGLMPSLRADIDEDHPRCFVTTTPKPIPLLREWLARTDGSVEVSRGSTFDNAINLSVHMLEEMRKRYEGTNIGRQELYGEMLDDMEGALFSYADIAATRVDIGPEHVAYRVVAVDPSLTGDENGDEMGVVVAIRDQRDHMYILEDASIRLVGREAALHCWRVFERYEADVLVFENNLGHAWMEQVLVDAYRELQRSGFFPENTNPPLKPVRSFQGKKLRAEPVSMRYQQHRIHMVGSFEELEKQLVGWDPLASRDSPDRLDAFVHACRYLMEGEKSKARLISPVGYTLPALSPMSRRGSAYVRRI
jgi:phage terminase large subunit-like protein